MASKAELLSNRKTNLDLLLDIKQPELMNSMMLVMILSFMMSDDQHEESHQSNLN